MKISLDFDDNDVAYEVMDAMFLAYLKRFRQDCFEYIDDAFMEADKKAYKKLVKSCDDILKHFEVPNGTRD